MLNNLGDNNKVNHQSKADEIISYDQELKQSIRSKVPEAEKKWAKDIKQGQSTKTATINDYNKY